MLYADTLRSLSLAHAATGSNKFTFCNARGALARRPCKRTTDAVAVCHGSRCIYRAGTMQSDTHEKTVQGVDPTTGKFVFKRVWEAGKATKMELHQKDVHEGPDPAGPISSWDWSKNGGGGSFHDRSEDTNLDGQHGNEDGFHQTYSDEPNRRMSLPPYCVGMDVVDRSFCGSETIPTSILCAGNTCT